MRLPKPLAKALESSTMYQLALRFLIGLVATGAVLSALSLLPFSLLDVVTSTVFLVVACFVINLAFAKAFRVTPSTQSSVISGLILSLIIGPVNPVEYLLPLTVAAAAAMGSKYLLRFGSHVFNPAAFGAVVMVLTTGLSASWWVGTAPMTPFVLIGGILVAYKARRLILALLFILTYLALFFAITLFPLDVQSQLSILRSVLISSPLLFLGLIMLTEPITSPSTYRHQVTYAVIVAGAIVAIQTLWPSIPYSFELALLAGNIFTRMTEHSPTYKLTLLRKERLAPKIINFVFKPSPPIKFIPGQFMEWTAPQKKTDSRGNRRWFTIASSPTEQEIFLTTKIADPGSTYKQTLQQLEPGSKITAHGVEGDFVLPSNKSEPLVFIAGGIGITPFHSMVKFLLDTKDKRPITLFYAANAEDELVYVELFREAERFMGLKLFPIISQPSESWSGLTGRINAEILRNKAPSIVGSTVYVSGPEAMVESVERMLIEIGVPRSQIKQDFFPGYGNELLV